MKRVWIALLAAVVALLAAVPLVRLVGIAPPQTFPLSDDMLALEQKYDIHIACGQGSDTSILDANCLQTLDQALETVTPELVRYVSAYYKEKTGSPLTFQYECGAASPIEGTGAVLGGFQQDTAQIQLYIPSRESPSITTGANPISIIHEFGHALHFMYTANYGNEKMREEWTAFNGGQAYSPVHIAANPDDRTFVSGYAATSYEEDVAETIGHVFVRYRAGQGFMNRLSVDSQLTNLGRKVAYIERILAALEPADGALQNYVRMYRSAPSVSYQEISFSGVHLQFAGYPPPAGVLDAILEELGKEQAGTVWIEKIGAWHVLQAQGPSLLVFPGGIWCELEDRVVERMAT